MRQSAWLNTAPKKAEGDRSAPICRLDKMRKDRDDKRFHPGMPRLEAGEYLISILFEVGPVESTGMGTSILSFGEITCWQERIGIELEPWEVRVIRRLSAAYIKESRDAEERDCPEPWHPADYVPDFSAVAMDMRAQMRADAAI